MGRFAVMTNVSNAVLLNVCIAFIKITKRKNQLNKNMTTLDRLSLDNLIGARKIYEKAKKMPVGILIETRYLELAAAFYKLTYAAYIYARERY